MSSYTNMNPKHHKTCPATIPGVDAKTYDAGVTINNSENQDGAQGFENKISGNGIEGRHNTTSFDANPTGQRVHICLTEDRQSTHRHPISGIVARNSNRFTESQDSPAKDELYTPFIIFQ